MICEYTVSKFCSGNITEIENYDKAISDNTQTWHCHHRMEIQPDGTRLSRKRMIEHDIYYNVDPCMLIFLTESEHRRIHTSGRPASDKMCNIARERMKLMKHDCFKGHKHKEETKNKISETLKGRKLVMVNGRRTYVK